MTCGQNEARLMYIVVGVRTEGCRAAALLSPVRPCGVGLVTNIAIFIAPADRRSMKQLVHRFGRSQLVVLFGRSVYYLLAGAGVDHGSEVYPVGCEVTGPLEQRIGARGLWGLGCESL